MNMNLNKWDIKLICSDGVWSAFGKTEDEEKFKVSGFGENLEDALICVAACINSNINARKKIKIIDTSEKIIMEDSQ